MNQPQLDGGEKDVPNHCLIRARNVRKIQLRVENGFGQMNPKVDRVFIVSVISVRLSLERKWKI